MSRRAHRTVVLMVAATVACGCGGEPTSQRGGDPARCAGAVRGHAAGTAPTKAFSWRDPAVDESSGIARLPGDLLASVNDAGNPATLNVASLEGDRVAEIRVPGVRNEDWEDLAASQGADGQCHLWIADTGDAYRDRKQRGLASRTEFALVRLSLPAPRQTPLQKAIDASRAESLPVAYPDGRGRNAEALLVHPREREIALVTKVGQRGPGETPSAGVWSVPTGARPDETTRLRRVGTVPLAGISGGAWSPDGSLVALRDATTAYVWPYADDLATTLAAEPVEIALPKQPQGEALTFTADGRSLLVSSEGQHTAVWRVPIPPSAYETTATPRRSASGPNR